MIKMNEIKKTIKPTIINYEQLTYRLISFSVSADVDKKGHWPLPGKCKIDNCAIFFVQTGYHTY